ncbi:MAG: hypothetical protein AAB401_16040 [Acidobacteriota bacterium]
MSDNLANQTTDPLPQPSIDERLYKIENLLAQVLEGQKSLSREIKERYVDLRERVEINNDKLSAVQRELNQIAKDIRNPAFS